MRTVTRNLLLGIGVVLVLLLALGAAPSLLRSGDPYYVSATVVGEVNATDENVTSGPNATAVDANTLSNRTHPFTTGALADAGQNRTGYSEPYWRGPVGIKGAFTHSPFDELAALRQRNPGATDGESVRLARNGTLYRVGVTQDRP
jgi:hypothetical protein